MLMMFGSGDDDDDAGDGDVDVYSGDGDPAIQNGDDEVDDNEEGNSSRQWDEPSTDTNRPGQILGIMSVMNLQDMSRNVCLLSWLLSFNTLW